MPTPATRLGSGLPISSGTPGYSKLPEKVPVTSKDEFIHSSKPAVPKKMTASKGPTSFLLRTVRGSMGTAKPSAPKALSSPVPKGDTGSPMVLVPLPETPVEAIKPRESLHRPREKQAAKLSKDELLEPDFLPDDQPKEEKMSCHQPLSLKGGFQPKEEDPSPPPKIRGEKQAALAAGPIVGELPPRLMGDSEKVVQLSKGEPVRTYKDEEGIEVTEFKQPSDPAEPWRTTVEIKTRIIDGVERKEAVQIRLDPAKIEEEAADALAPTE